MKQHLKSAAWQWRHDGMAEGHLNTQEAKRTMIAQMRSLGIGLLALTLVVAVSSNAAAGPKLDVDHKTVDQTDPVKVTFSHGPGGSGEWVGLFPVGTALTNLDPYVDWQWVTGGREDAGTATSGKLTFPTDGQRPAVGQYVFRLISGGVVVAESPELTVNPSEAPALVLDRTTADSSGPVKVKFSYGPGGLGEWIGLFPVTGLTDVKEVSSYVDWQYVTGGRTPAGTATEGTLTFPTGGQTLPEGQYVFRFISGGAVIAQSALLTLTDSSRERPALELSQYEGSPTDSVKVKFSHGSKGNREWIGLFHVTAEITDISSYLDWQWVKGGQTKIAFDKDGKLTFPTNGPLPVGQYVYRWISDGKVIAQSAVYTVGSY
jgi:hypothetical protein